MKKLMWFLLGFSLVVFPVRFVYADIVYPSSSFETALYNYVYSQYGSYYSPYTSKGVYTTDIEAQSQLTSIYTTLYPSSIDGYSYVRVYIYRSAYNGYIDYSTRLPNPPPDWLINPTSDTDGDGIPDECDFYPNDPSPYQFKRLAYMSDDSFAIYITDRGDYFSSGGPSPDGPLDYYDYSAEWMDPSPTCGDMAGFASGTAGGSTSPATNSYPGTAPNGSPSGGDPVFSSGVDPDGTESGSDQKIISNTKATADNVAKQGQYLKDINKGIQAMDRNVAKQGETFIDIDKTLKEISGKLGDGSGIPVSGGDGDGEDGGGDPAEDWAGVGHSDAWSDGSMTDLTAGEDYTEHGDLADESFIQTLLANNPIQAALDNSGFLLSGAVCSVTLNLGSTLGTHTLSLCEFASEIATAGNILFGFTVLLSLLIVARGI